MSTESGYRNLPRRRFSREFKREVVELLNEEAATVAEVARAYDLHPNQLFRWRTEYCRGAYGPVEVNPADTPVLLSVELAEQDEVLSAVKPPTGAHPRIEATVAAKRLRRLRIVLRKGEIHLEDVDSDTLSMLVEALK